MTDSTPAERPYSVLFVCLGNICRSPLAEGVFLHLARERGLADRYRVDSAGTGGWHAGESPDPRSVDVARRHGIRLQSVARQVRREDLSDFDLILAMDQENVEALGAPPAGAATRIALLREWDPEAGDGPGHDRDVPDPYYGGPDGFDRVFAMVRRSCEALLDHLEAKGER